MAERKPWRKEGHPFIGKMARRFFTAYGISDGRIVGWLPRNNHAKHGLEPRLFFFARESLLAPPWSSALAL